MPRAMRASAESVLISWPASTTRPRAGTSPVIALIERGALRPQSVTTQVVGWEDAPRVWLEPGVKLVVQRA